MEGGGSAQPQPSAALQGGTAPEPPDPTDTLCTPHCAGRVVEVKGPLLSENKALLPLGGSWTVQRKYKAVQGVPGAWVSVALASPLPLRAPH